MKQFSGLNFNSVVNFLNATLLVSLVFFCLNSFARESSGNSNSTGGTNSSSNGNSNNNGGNDNFREDPCLTASSQITAATTKIGDACRKAGFGGNCTASTLSCEEELEEESPSSWGALAAALVGSVMGASQQDVDALSGADGGNKGSGTCPQMNAKDYKTEKKEIDEKIKDANKEIDSLKKEMVEDQKLYNDKSLEIKTDLEAAEKELKTKNREIDKDEREQLAEITKGLQEANAQIRQKRTDMLNIQGQMALAIRQKATDLLNVSGEAVKAACMGEVNKIRQDYVKLVGQNKNYMTQASNKKALLVSTYNICMTKFSNQRTSIVQDNKQKMTLLQKQYDDLKSELDNIQQSIDLANTQMAEMKKANQEEKDDELAALIQKNQNAQTELANLYNETQAKLNNNQTRIAQLNGEINKYNAEYTALGPVPKGGTSYTPGEAAGELNAALDSLRGIKSAVVGKACATTVTKQIDDIIESKSGSGSSRDSGSR